jgi:hypothetical protein
VPTRGLRQVRARRHGAVQEPRWGQAVPTRGLRQVRARRHGRLHHAWGRQAVPSRWLPQVRTARHGRLRRAWRGQAVPSGWLPQVRSRRHGCLRRAWRGQAVQRGWLAVAGAASTWVAPRQLSLAARSIVSRMAGASAARRRAAPRQSLGLEAARSARCVCGPHSRSPTARGHSTHAGIELGTAPASLQPVACILNGKPLPAPRRRASRESTEP